MCSVYSSCVHFFHAVHADSVYPIHWPADIIVCIQCTYNSQHTDVVCMHVHTCVPCIYAAFISFMPCMQLVLPQGATLYALVANDGDPVVTMDLIGIHLNIAL